MKNLDEKTVAGFGDEWARFDQSELTPQESLRHFEEYFSLFPWDRLPKNSVGFDMGCGSGRWALHVAPRVGTLHCVDASDQALGVARRNLSAQKNCQFHHASVDALPFARGSMDFGYSLGVLHHIPDTLEAMRRCTDALKPGAPFLVYLYYRFDNRPAWFQKLWQVSDRVRRVIAALPVDRRHLVTDVIAGTVYLPLARTAGALDRLGVRVDSFPLSAYRGRSFYSMRTDALDRFGTRLEQRFTRDEVRAMMEACGLERISFRDGIPYWCALGYRR
ncbi:MAG: class I SAM-dependent methyltransferase [Archangium sp.]|nr:class I SAM-dependent methyltransferase [Archangium sp.]